jgi:hypothetical protein
MWYVYIVRLLFHSYYPFRMILCNSSNNKFEFERNTLRFLRSFRSDCVKIAFMSERTAGTTLLSCIYLRVQRANIEIQVLTYVRHDST